MSTMNVIQEQRPATRADVLAPGYGVKAGAVLLVVSITLALGRIFDLGVLWLLQRQNSPQWEFMALSNTIDAVPGLMLTAGLAYLAFHLMGVRNVLSYRLLAIAFILLALMAATAGGLLAMDYLALARYSDPRAAGILRSTSVRGMVLSGLYFLLLLPVGIYALKQPRTASRRS